MAGVRSSKKVSQNQCTMPEMRSVAAHPATAATKTSATDAGPVTVTATCAASPSSKPANSPKHSASARKDSFGVGFMRAPVAGRVPRTGPPCRSLP
jgi:hypothetical protein